MLLCCHKARMENCAGRKQGLLSSGKKITGSDFGVWRRRRAIVAAIAALVLLPIEVSDAGGLSDFFKRSAKPDKSPAHVTSPKPATPAKPAAAAVATPCDPSKFRIVVDVGHTAESEGAISARNVAEYLFNLRLAQRVEEKLKSEGFPETKLLVTEGKARPSLVKRVAKANNLHANLFLSIHHDSVPDKLLENWEFEGKKSHFSDRFSGYSVYVSHDNPDFKTSLAFAELVAKEMKAQGLQYAQQYTQPIMGQYRHPILNKETGVYSYDHLVVLRSTQMPAVLLEAGSIINRDEELKMDSAEHRDIVSTAVATAVKQFCAARSAQVAR
jgi:N-acetylmuramoyl-L-alanine amidase